MRRLGLVLGAALGFVALVTRAAPSLERAARSWPWRVAVSGHSMEPGLLDGDWLLVDPVLATPLRPGDTVVAVDPRSTGRLIVKRIVALDEDGVTLTSDHPAHAGEAIGPVAAARVIGRPWLRYWPPSRIGRL